jgi:LemA protein
MSRYLPRTVVPLLMFLLVGCGYNDLQGLDENVKAAWSEVQNQYQRRADLIPNLVNVVKGYAAHERETLDSVTEARAKVGSMQVTPQTLNDPQAFKKFEEAQAGLSSALSRLMVVVERYPDLKANQNFLDLQSQLEGTENRITVARKRYIDAVNDYNKMVRYFPTNLTARYLLHLDVRQNFTATTPGVEKPPEVKF